MNDATDASANTQALAAFSLDSFMALPLPGFDSQRGIHWDHNHGERRSGVVGHLWQGAAELVAANRRVLVIRGEDHHVRMPMADPRAQVLVRGPHVREGHRIP